jgi:glutamine amidotransferase
MAAQICAGRRLQSMKIVIVDYGMGNIKSITSSINYLGVEDVVLSSDFEIMKRADKLILPGVGSFGKAIARIRDRGIDKHLFKLVVEDEKPLLGICLGMQLMGKCSDEDGNNTGLGLVDGTVKKFDQSSLKVPHVGFNQVQPHSNSKLFSGISGDPDFYFTHSYRMLEDNGIKSSICNYGGDFVAAFEHNNIAGVQFHPELSQGNGLKLIKNFIEKF